MLQAQSAEKVIDAYLRANGGARAVAQIRDSTLAGSLNEDAAGKAGTFTLITKAPNRYYLELIVAGERAVEAYNGMSAWGQDADGVHTLTGTAAREAPASGRYWGGRLTDLRKAKITVQLAGRETVRSQGAQHVKVSLGPGLDRDTWFGEATHLLLREAGPAGRFEYDDYRAVGGLQMPHRIELERGGHKYSIVVARALVNSGVEDAVFDFPRGSTAPLPDIKALLMDVVKNQKALEELAKQYTCHLNTEEQKVDGKGQVASRTVKEFEVFYVTGEEVRRLVSKDGKALAGDEKKKEDERFNKEFEKLQKHAAELAADPKKQKKEDEKTNAQVSDILRALKFSNARRERFRGQDVIAVDMGPNPEYKPKKTVENIVQKLAGVVWIDEQARDVARLEAHFTDSAKVGAGILAALDKGSSLVFENAKVNGEVWLPVYSEVHASGRVVFVKLKSHEINRYSDYKKFHAESTIKIVQE
jgi:hypothetical protein